MSPNTNVLFNDDGILCAYPGEHDGEEPCFVWTYSVFENFIQEAITPSMYFAMAGFVRNNLSKEELYELQAGEYAPGNLEASAIDAYFDEPLNDRIEMHEQTLVNLRAAQRLAEARESAAIDAMLEENKPFDSTSPINQEYCEFMRGIIAKSRKEFLRLDREIHEEEQWRGGHEEGESDLDTDPQYDHMEEF
jgi:hypothetical protein